MSRSGYMDDCEAWDLIRYRGAVTSAIRGARGQAFLKEMLQALDSLPERKLVAGELEEHGSVCAIGAVGRARGIDMTKLDPDESERVATAFGIADSLAREVVYMNDEGSYRSETPEMRFDRMRKWVVDHINKTAAPNDIRRVG